MKNRILVWLLSLTITVTSCFYGVAYAGTERESSKEEAAVTVYFTLSEDGEFVTGNDEEETVLSHIPVTISYFDLAEYGLEDFYRYEADSFENGGEYIGTEVLEQPTLLHLYIKMLEEYYLADGSELVVNDRNQDALSISGSATSLYMTRFWGHDENLMYYVNHKYPLQAAGWGSTSDYILLEDGMEIDVAMFSDWDFYHTGAFAYFTGNNVEAKEPGQFDIAVNEKISLTMRGTATNAAYDGNSTFVGEPMCGENVVYCKKEQAVSDYTNKNWEMAEGQTDENGNITLSFSSPGTYYVSSTPLYESYQLSSGNACVAPPIAVIHVTGEQETEEIQDKDYSGGLISDVVVSDGVSALADRYTFSPAFTEETKEYVITVPDYEDSLCVKASLAKEAPKRTAIIISYQDLTGEDREVSLDGKDTLGRKLAKIISKGVVGNTFILTAVCKNYGTDDVTEVYHFRILRQATLENINIHNTNTQEEISLTPEFSSSEYDYEVHVNGNTQSLTVTADVLSGIDHTITIDDKDYDADGNVVVDLSSASQKEVTITVKNDNCIATVYTITIHKSNIVAAEITLLEGSILQIVNAKGVTVERYRSTGGPYIIENLSEGEEYTYTISKYGYRTIQSSFVAASGGKIDGILKSVAANEKIDKNISGQWSNFRGSDTNNGLTNALTPTDYTNAELYWAKKVGTGFGSGAPSSPILVDDCLVYTTATTIVKADTITGEILASGKMVRTSAFNITPPTYAEGMIFVALASGTIQAFNAKTLESLWVYQDPLYGQPNSPISYCDGYIYTGFWNGETGNANYVCLSVTDEDVKETTEKKYATWTSTSKGGFYWAGSYACRNFVVVGTDDGENSEETGTSNIIVFDAFTGSVIDKYDGVVGDTRSSICFDEVTGRYYFTSKGGYFYSMEISEEGKITDVENIALGSASTSTPVVSNGRAYVGVKGSEQFGANSGHHIAVIDLGSMRIAYKMLTRGYPQTSGIATTGYTEKDGYTYVYFVDNYEPGKIRVLKDKPGQNEPVITRFSAYEDENDNNVLFSPKAEQANYAICSLIADAYGTLYFKNDSAYMMALGSKIEKIEVTKKPDKLNYMAGESFEPTGMVVTATYANGLTRDITKYVTYDTGKLTGNMSDVEIRFPYVLYNDELLNYQSFDPLIDTVDITVSDPEGLQKAQHVMDKIGAIDNPVTLNSKDKIKAAREAYDSIDSALEVYITNYKTLTDAESRFSQLVTEYFKRNRIQPVATQKSIQEVLVTWNGSPYADGYMLYRSEKKDGDYKEIGRVTTLSYRDTAVVLGRSYYYKVIPFVSMDSQNKNLIRGEEGTVSIKITLKAPKKLKLSIKKKSAKKKYVKLKWNKLEKASGYVIYRSTKKKGKYKKIKVIKSGKNTTFTDKKVKQKKKYFYKIRGYRTINGKKVYGKYSVIRKIKVK